MAPSNDPIDILKERLEVDGIKLPTLEEILKLNGEQALVKRKFVGYDRDYSRTMIYRVDEYNHNNRIPLLKISELTVIPRARTSPFISLDLHTNDLEVTNLDLNEVAGIIGLPKDKFYLYV